MSGHVPTWKTIESSEHHHNESHGHRRRRRQRRQKRRQKNRQNSRQPANSYTNNYDASVSLVRLTLLALWLSPRQQHPLVFMSQFAVYCTLLSSYMWSSSAMMLAM